MKNPKTNKIITAIVALAALSMAGFAYSGSLTPPVGVITGTMETLTNIYASIASNAFDSSSVTANANGSLLGTLKYIDDQLVWASSSNDAYYLGTGNVGIGTSTPGYKLEIGTPGDINLASSGAGYRIGGATVLTDKGTQNIWVGESAGSSITTGSYLAGVGYEAYRNNTTGSQGTALGYQALRSNTGGSFNNAVGYQALYTNTTGQFNNALGAYALTSNTSGNNNSAVGYQAMYSNSTGQSNSAFGNNAMYWNSTGQSNSALGYNALFSGTTGSRNTAMGSAALYSLTTGFDNIAVGASAGYSLTTASQNSFVGRSAGYTITTGSFNSALGYQALYSDTTGQSNVAIGRQALYTNTTGSGNTATGLIALYYNTTGAGNSAHGSQALYNNTTGSYNTADGYQALYTNTTGQFNTAVGYLALGNNTSGSMNVALGNDAARYNTTGTYNLAAGFSALHESTTGWRNVALGYQSLYLSDSASDNIAIGGEALYLDTTGSDNIAIGASAGYSALGSGNVFIGRSAGSSETGSSKLYIDNSGTANPLIYGEFDTNYLSFGANVSISSNLEVTGTASLSGDLSLSGTTSKLIFDGSTPDANKTTLAVTDPTSSRNFLLPDIVTTGGNAGNLIARGTNGFLDDQFISTKLVLNNLFSDSVDGETPLLSVFPAGVGAGAGGDIGAGDTFGLAEFQIPAGMTSTTGGEIYGLLVQNNGSQTVANESALWVKGNWDNVFELEGQTDDSMQTHIRILDPTANGTIFIPRNLSGVFALVSSGSQQPTNTGDFELSGLASISGRLSVTSTVSFASDLILPNLPNTDGSQVYLCLDDTTSKVSSGSTCTPSALRFKTNIQSLTHGLDWVSQLRPVTFDWKKNGAPSLGFIAEDVEQVSPLLAIYQGGQIYSVNYQIMTAVLAKAIQEQQTMIDAIQASIASGSEPLAEDEGLFGRIEDYFSGIILHVKELVTHRVTADELQMIDSATGRVYCVRIVNGEWDKTPGECGDTSMGGDPEPADEPPVAPAVVPSDEGMTPPADTSSEQTTDVAPAAPADTTSDSETPSGTSTSKEPLPPAEPAQDGLPAS